MNDIVFYCGRGFFNPSPESPECRKRLRAVIEAKFTDAVFFMQAGWEDFEDVLQEIRYFAQLAGAGYFSAQKIRDRLIPAIIYCASIHEEDEFSRDEIIYFVEKAICEGLPNPLPIPVDEDVEPVSEVFMNNARSA